MDALKRLDKAAKRKIAEKSFDYDYGDLGDKMKPSHPVHDRLVDYALDIAHRGFSAMEPCYDLWQKADHKATAYVTPEEANPRNNERDRPRNIIVPLTFRMEEMYMGAFHGVFNQDPIFKFKPLPGADSLINAATMEYMVQRHALWFDTMLHADDVVRDSFRYGIGMGCTKWRVDRARKPVDREITSEVISMAKASGINIDSTQVGRLIRDMEEQVVCEGTEIEVWDPYRSFYDTSVTPNRYNRAAYKGTVLSWDATQLLRYERENEGYWFNGKYAKALAETGQALSQFNNKQQNGRSDRNGTVDHSDDSSIKQWFAPIDILYVIADIIPLDWQVGEEDYPVKYVIALAGDEIIVAFYPIDYAHGGDGTFICAPNADGHSFVPVSHELVTYGIAEHLDVLAQATQASVMKNVNGGWTIFNHNVLNWDDFVENREAGKVIRPVVPALTKEMMEAAIVNIPHIDNSGQHQRYMAEWMAIASDGNGTSDIGGLGELAGADRQTKYGAMAQVNSSSSRFKRLAYKIGAQFMTPVGWMMAYNLVQFGTQPQQVDLGGRFADRIRKQMGLEPTQQSFMADPRDLQLNFEMEPYTGSMPQTSDVSGMGEIAKVLLSMPEVAMGYADRAPAIINAYLRKSGFENIDEYEPMQTANVQPMPDQQIEQQVQAGNLVPQGPIRSM